VHGLFDLGDGRRGADAMGFGAGAASIFRGRPQTAQPVFSCRHALDDGPVRAPEPAKGLHDVGHGEALQFADVHHLPWRHRSHHGRDPEAGAPRRRCRAAGPASIARRRSADDRRGATR
jgi:hypothetical protein